jgi:VCBS repeat protein
MQSRLPGGVLGVVLWSSVAYAGRHHHHGNESYFFVEESHRLPANNEPPGTSSTGVNLVDVDGDGDLDLFLAAGTASLDPRPNKLFINNGHGFFTDETATRLPLVVANSAKADFADIDDDGDLDGIVAVVGPELLYVNDGRGHFSDGSARLPAPLDIFHNISSDVHFADVNGDGCSDVLVSNENPFDPDPLHGAQNFLWMNQTRPDPHGKHGGHHHRYRCTGSFVDETAARLPAITDQTTGMRTADIDCDGDLDLIVLNRGQDNVFVNDGDGVFANETAARFPVTSDATRDGALVDLNDDGWPDLVTSNSRNQPPQLYVNTGDGFFVQGTFGYSEAPNETDTALLVEDLDHDGRPDVYIANAGKFDSGHGFEGGPDHLFKNHPSASGTFVDVTDEHARFPALQASTAAAFGDLDGDGDDDLVVAGTGEGEVGRERVFLQKHRHSGHGDDEGD